MLIDTPRTTDPMTMMVMIMGKKGRKEKKQESEDRENVEKTAKQLRSHYEVYLMNKFDFVPLVTKALFDFHKTSKLII